MSKRVFVNEAKGAVVVILRGKKYAGKGIAKCNIASGDKFDQAVGLEIATKRAELAYKAEQKRTYKKHIGTLKAQIDAYEGLVAGVDVDMKILNTELNSILDKV